jgi:hypothetical protein
MSEIKKSQRDSPASPMQSKHVSSSIRERVLNAAFSLFRERGFSGRLGLAHAAEAAQRSPALRCQCLLQLRQHKAAQKLRVERAAAEEQGRIAQAAADTAERALTDSFFRTIGVSNQDVAPRDEREALWELAQLDRANATVRDNLLKRWFGTAEAFMRGEARGAQGFRAATGLNLEYHRLSISGTAELGRRLVGALENPRETDSARLSSLGSALVALADKMEVQAVAKLGRRLVATLENPQETDSVRLSSLGRALAAFYRLLPSTRHTPLLALSNMLLQPVSKEAGQGKEQPYDRKLLAEVCAQLSTEDLAEVLKYPFCTAEAEQIVLKQVSSEAKRDFGGDVWKFVEQADSLGIKDIDSPAKRPSVQDALKELDGLIGVVSAPTTDAK